MKIFDLIGMCLRNLARRKFRTLLTMIGVVLGTCAVVMMIALGLGMQQSLTESLSQMGDLTLIHIYAYGNVDAQGQPVYLDDKAVQTIQKMPGVKTATPFYNPRNLDAQLFAGRNDRYSTFMYNVVGVYPEALPLLGYELTSGTWEEAFSKPYSILMGQYAAYQFQDNRKTRGNNRVDPFPDATGKIPDPYVDVLQDKLLIRLTKQNESSRKVEYKPTVSGVLKEDFQRGYETSRGMFMSIDDVKAMEAAYIKANNIKVDKNTSSKGYENASVKVSQLKDVATVEEAIKAMGFDTYSMETIRKPMEEQAKKQQSFLGTVAGVSLVVAALFIINTMLMSVYERTREIGIMKVVGCTVEDIRKNFLIEAGMIGFLGGVVGVAFSYLLSFLLNYLGVDLGMGGGMQMLSGNDTMASVFIIPLWLVLSAIAFSTLIGLVSGYYPAYRAVKISALTAIKQE